MGSGAVDCPNSAGSPLTVTKKDRSANRNRKGLENMPTLVIVFILTDESILTTESCIRTRYYEKVGMGVTMSK